MDDFFEQYHKLALGGFVVLYISGVLSHPEHGGELPPLAPTAPLVEPMVVVSSAPSGLAD